MADDVLEKAFHSLFGHPAPNKWNTKFLLSHSGITIFWTCISVSQCFSWSLIQKILKHKCPVYLPHEEWKALGIIMFAWNCICPIIKFWILMKPWTMVMPMHVISSLHVHSNESTFLTYIYTGILWHFSKTQNISCSEKKHIYKICGYSGNCHALKIYNKEICPQTNK
jgi:hypothetical protein